MDSSSSEAHEEPCAAAGEHQLRLLGDITHDLAWEWDLRTGQIIYNREFRDALGEAPADYAAANAWWKTRVHPGDLERIEALYESAMRENATRLAYEYRIRQPGNGWLTLDSRVNFLRDAAGAVQRVLVASRDITKRRRAEEAQARLTRILEATTDFVGMATAEGVGLFINAAGRRMVGIPLEEELDLRITAVHPQWANEIVMQEALPAALRDGYWKGETALLHRDGREIPVSQVMLSHPGEDGAVEFISTIMRDLSDRKREDIERIEWANRYDAAIRASGQVLFDWNSYTGEITYAGSVERLFGCGLEEMAGGLERLRQLIEPTDLPRFDQRVQQAIATRDPFELQFRVRDSGAGSVFVEAKGYFFLDRRGQIGRMVGFFSDITAEQRAQEALAQAHGNLEQRVAARTAELARASADIADRARQQEAVAELGQKALAGATLGPLMERAMEIARTILRVDCCSLLALTVDGREFVVRAQIGWSDPDKSNRVPAGYESQSGFTVLAGEPVIVAEIATEQRFKMSEQVRAEGLRSSISVLIEGEAQPLGALIAFTRTRRDFTQDDVHFLQAVANVLTAAIQRERAEENIRTAREAAELASRAKSEFLSRMSHELRTPLNAILGFTQLLELDTLSVTQTESVSHISQAGRHLLSLINEVLDISRIEAGRLALNPEEIELPDFLSLVLDLIRPLAERHGIALQLAPSTATPPHAVLADRPRLQQVLLNLLSNAVKYNRPGGRVSVSYRDDGHRLRISVVDTGRGIEPEKLARLFLPFERLGAESTEVDGTGIGLALSRGIVAALHGELNVESRLGEGSTFWVALPRPPLGRIREGPPAPAPAPPATLPGLVLPMGEPAVLLYIEDQDLNLRLVERILLTRSQYRLLTAMTGGAGLDVAREHRPDLILLDLNLPDMAGDEVLRQLKEDPALRKIPVVMVSADAMGDRVEELLRQGAANYLTKPYKLTELLRVIEETLATRIR